MRYLVKQSSLIVDSINLKNISSDAYNSSDIVFMARGAFILPNDSLYTFLYMHEVEKCVALVQNKVKLDVHLKTYLIMAVPVMLALWVVFRKAFRVITKNPRTTFIDVILDTWGTFLATSCNIRINNRPESILHLNILLLSVLITNIFTAVLFNYLMSKEITYGFETLKELADHNVTITINELLNETNYYWIQNYR